MPELPFSEYFQHIHPLNKDTDVQQVLKRFNLPEILSIPLSNQYDYVLQHSYLTPKKLATAIDYLNSNFQGATLLEKYEQFVYSNIQPYGDRTRDLDYNGICFFWVYTLGAFLHLNAFISDGELSRFYKSETAFAHSNTLKQLWIARQGQRQGGNKRAHSPETKERFHRKWLSFSAHLKQLTYKSALELYECRELYSAEEFAKEKRSPAMRTLKDWVREWKKAL